MHTNKFPKNNLFEIYFARTVRRLQLWTNPSDDTLHQGYQNITVTLYLMCHILERFGRTGAVMEKLRTLESMQVQIVEHLNHTPDL